MTMAVKIITDSLGDVPREFVEKYDITVIPINVLFGTESFRDGIDMTTDQFYTRLVSSKTLPTSAVPALGTFTSTYEEVAKKTDEILVITISHFLSATYETALSAAKMVEDKVKVKVIDSLQVIMGQGMLVIEAAEAAQKGASMEELVEMVQRDIKRVESRMAFDTLEYLKKGGRIGAGQAFLGSILKINPILYLKDGEIFPLSRERSRTKAIDALHKFVTEDYEKIDAISVEDATTPEEADKLVERIQEEYPDVPIYRSKVSAVIGVHVGPSVIAVSVLGDKKG
jgi:DegV family protein with EDD domain